MKSTYKYFFPLLFFISPLFSFGQQWNGSSTTNGSINRSGRVGIGVDSTLAPLEVRGPNSSSSSQNVNGIFIISSNGTNLINTFGVHTDLQNQMPYSWIQASHRLSPSATYSLVLNPRGGKIGIGTITPKKELHVSGDYYGRGHLFLYAFEGDGNSGTAYIQARDLSDSSNIGIQFRTQLNGSINNSLKIHPDGKVGIGTSDTGTHKLAVEGTIGAREIKVESNGWSDFVFEDNYRLMKLTDLENFIHQNRHLPDIPKESEVLTNGIELGKMDSKLLQKIEELTLYTIEQEKKIKELEKKLQEVEKLKTMISILLDKK